MGWLENWSQDDGIALGLPLENVIDLSSAVILYDSENLRQETYTQVLLDAIYKSSRCSWTRMDAQVAGENDELPPDLDPNSAKALIRLVLAPSREEDLGDEGYEIVLSSRGEVGPYAEVQITGATDRSVLFGIGRFLREIYADYNISYSKPLASVCYVSTKHARIVSVPAYRMRQHQVAYRPKTNSYDAFTPEMMRREILDLALFGCNAIEVIPPGIDDALQSPQFSVSWMDMLRVVSEWCDKLDIRLSIWYPAYFSYSTEEDMAKAEAHWHAIFSALTRLDALFVPGGDPGGRPAVEFFKIVEKQARFLREKFFPSCEIWVSSQYGLSVSYDLGTDVWVPLKEELNWMHELDAPYVGTFLSGVVYGPWSVHPIDEFRALVPSKFPLRNYPDLCHVQTAELPVAEWDLSFATTNNRESINPRPREMLRIFEEQAPYTIGCGCYSEGVNDDVNKYVWTVLHWGPDRCGPCEDASNDMLLYTMLKQYAGLLMEQWRNAEVLAEIILGLENNWKGSALRNPSIMATMRKFISLDHTISPRHRKNWRYNMLQFRAYHDAFIRLRLFQEAKNESEAISVVDCAARASNDVEALLSPANVNMAMKFLAVPYEEPAMTLSSFESPSNPDALNVVKLHETPTVTHLYGRLMALAALLFQQIGYQLSVGFGGQHRQRGAYMDLIWAPLGDVMYLNRVFSILKNGGQTLGLRDMSLKDRFVTSVLDRHKLSGQRVVWYASFGDEDANELPGACEEPTRSLPMQSVLPPYRQLELGEDPYFFTRPLVEYLDCSNDEVLRDLHTGLIPRAWRSYIEPIWPRTAKFNMHFELNKLGLLPGKELFVRITYLGRDLNRHGGDWEELNREAMPLAMKVNGFQVHEYLDPPEITQTRTFAIPQRALERAKKVNNLIVSFVPKNVDKVTFRCVPIPIAEMWLMEDSQESLSKL